MTRADAVLRCPNCGRALATDALAGVCPACAWDELTDVEASEPEEKKAGTLFSIAGHLIVEEIARGGGGIVYRARQVEPAREVALKILPPHQLASPEMKARFRGEAETIAAMDHPAILPVYSTGEHEGAPFFTMKLATGGTLGERREALRGRWREIATLVAELAGAVHHAHLRGVIHRDLKPGNVLFDDAGRAFISDFGLAKFIHVEHGLTQPSTVFGTPNYLAPEVAERGAAHATTGADIYSLGAIFFELLAGRPPFEADTLTVLLKQIATQPPPRPASCLPRVPRDLEIICLRCLAKQPGDRFLTAGLLAEDLRRWLDGRPIVSRPVSPLERFAHWTRRNPARVTLSAALTVASLATAVVLVRSNHRLGQALSDTQKAEVEAGEQLHRALLAEARNKRESGRTGQRFESVATLERAARLRSDAAVAGELASALARPDFRLLRRFEQAAPGVRTPVAFGPDAAVFARILSEGGVGIFRSDSGAMIHRLPAAPGQVPTGLVFSEFGPLIAIEHWRGTLIWNTDTETLCFELPPGAFAFDPRNEGVAFAGPNGTLCMGTSSEADRLLSAADPAESVRALSFSPDGSRLAVVRERSIAILDTQSGARTWRAAATLLAIAPAWSPDGTQLAVARDERHEIALLDARSGDLQRLLVGHTGDPVRLAFHPGGQRLYSSAYDLSLRLWDTKNGHELLRAVLPVSGFVVSKDGRRLGAAIDAETPALFEAAPEDVFREFATSHYSEARASRATLTASPDGRWLATSSGFPMTTTGGGPARKMEVRLWDTQARREVASFTYIQEGETSVSFASDGSALVYGNADGSRFRRTLEKRDDALVLGDEEQLGSPFEQPTTVQSSSRDGGDNAFARWVVTAVEGPALEIRALSGSATSNPRRIPLEREALFEISPDGRWLVAGNDWGFQTWRLEDLQPGPAWPALRDGDRFRFAGFSPDGRWLATEVSQGMLELRSAKTFSPLIRLTPPADYALSRMAWAPDGSAIYLMGPGPRIFLWDIVALRAQLAARGLDWQD